MDFGFHVLNAKEADALSKFITIKLYSKGGIWGMKKQICTCDFCKKVIEDPISRFGGADYGLIPFSNSGEIYVDFDACDECLKKIILDIQRKKLKDPEVED